MTGVPGYSAQWSLTLSLLLLLNCKHVEMRCIHDDIAVRAVQATKILYQDNTSTEKLLRVKRDDGHMSECEEIDGHSIETAELFQPLRIHIHHSPSASLDEDTHTMVKTAVERAVQRISTVLSVIPVQGLLLLSRFGGCSSSWPFGINKGKCSRLEGKYRIIGEKCLNIFRIPDAHLEGLSVYNATHPKPVYELRAGPGVNNSDVILYVISRASRQCLAQDRGVVAFASHCQVDKGGRPVAGLVNFCPFTLSKAMPTRESLYATALHEILHVLGFSKKLFSNIRNCKGSVCKKAFRERTVNGQLRLVSPTVVNMTRQHFGCYTGRDFGGPLEATFQNYELVATSHWESTIMRTSLMTARADNALHTVLDPITLALLEDSGWYKVNFSNADTFLWGRGAGCLFALPGHCLQNREYFCSDNSSGCHFLLKDKAVCSAAKTSSKCRVYVPDPQGSCTQSMEDATSEGDSLEIFSTTSGCFLSTVGNSSSQDQPVEFTGQCYNRWCARNGTVFVKLQGTEWIECPTRQTVQVSGLPGEIQCPRNTDVVCTGDTRQEGIEDTTLESHLTSVLQQQDSTPFTQENTERSKTNSPHPASVDTHKASKASSVHVEVFPILLVILWNAHLT